MPHGRSFRLLLAATLASMACASQRPPQGPGVAVYQVPWQTEGVAGVPAGCRLLAVGLPQSWSETDLASVDTFRDDRAKAAAQGANVLLLVEKLVVPRRSFDCASSQPITDCPATLGAWYEVVVRSYDCDAAARSELPKAPQ